MAGPRRPIERPRFIHRRMISGVVWSLVMLGIASLAIGAASCRWRFTRHGARCITEIHGGMIEFHWNHRRTVNAPIWRGWTAWSIAPPDRWSVRSWTPSSGTNPLGGWRYCFVPIWMAAAPPLAAGGAWTAIGLRQRRRTRDGRCTSCGYDLRGLRAPAVCPECGAPGRNQRSDSPAA